MNAAAIMQAFTAETPTSLETAGIRLDVARIKFDAMVSISADEDAFGQAESAWLDALAAYKAELSAAAGCDADAILRRLM